MKTHVTLGALVAIVAGALIVAPQAVAAPSGAVLANRVERAANPQAAFNKLSRKQKSMVVYARKNQMRFRIGSPKTTRSWRRNRPPLLIDSCHSGLFQTRIGWSAWGGRFIAIGTSQLRFDWCHNSQHITSYRTYDADSWMTFPGVSFKSTTIAQHNAGWEARGRARFTYQFAWDKLGFEKHLCLQARGGYNLYSMSASCNLIE